LPLSYQDLQRVSLKRVSPSLTRILSLKPVARETYLLWQVAWQRRRSEPGARYAVVPVVFPCALAARDRRIAVALEALKSPIAIAVAVAVALAGVAPIFQKAKRATSAPVNMVIIDLPPNLTTAAAGAAHCVGGEVVVVVHGATPVRVPDVIRAGIEIRGPVHCAIVSVDALTSGMSGAAVVRYQILVLDIVELGRRDDRLRAGRVGRGVLVVLVR